MSPSDSDARESLYAAAGGMSAGQYGQPPGPAPDALVQHRQFPTPVETRHGDLDVKRQLHIVRRHLRWVLLISAFSAVAAGLVGMTGTPVWQGKQNFLVHRDSYVRVDESLYSLLSDESLPSNMKDALRADDEAGQILQNVSLSLRAEGASGMTARATAADPESVRNILRRVEPAFSAKFQEAIARARAALEDLKSEREGEFARVTGRLSQLTRAKRRIQEMEDDYENESLRAETLKERRRSVQARYGPEVARTGNEQTADLKRTKLVEQIVSAEMQEAEMRNRYQEDHPQLKAVTVRLEELRRELAAMAPTTLVGGELQQLVGELEFSEARKSVLKNHLEQERQKYSTATAGGNNEIDLQIRSALLNQQVAQLNDRLGRIEATRGIPPLTTLGDLEVDAPPGWQRRLMRSVPFGLLLGLLLGIMFALGVEYMRDTCSTPGEVFRDLGLPTMAIIPKVTEEGSVRITSADPHSHLAEMFSILRNNVRYSAQDMPHKLLMITSPLAGEGKSMVAMNLASSFAFEGLDVLLIDSDLRRSKGYAVMSGQGDAPGLLGWLSGTVDSPQHAICQSSEPGLFVLPAGGKATNATKLFSGPRMAELLNWAQTNYDVVVVDTPAVLPVADTTIFANLARGILLVVDASGTRSVAARSAILRLTHTRGNVVGAILNRADHRASGYMSYYGYSYGYGRYGYRYASYE